jgi:hypothetical protein
MNWEIKRYVELPWDTIPCDPKRAVFEKEKVERAIENGTGYEQKMLTLKDVAQNIESKKDYEAQEDWGDQPF